MKSPLHIRYAVYTSNRSPHCAQHTPRYFNEKQGKQALEYAQSIGSYVIDLFKEMSRHDND